MTRQPRQRAMPPPRRPNLPFQAPVGSWDRRRCLEAIRAWTARFGDPPRAYEWRPDAGRALGRLPLDRLCRWEREHPRWPSTGTVRKHCGGWTDALYEAGVGSAPVERLPLAERVEAARRLAADGLGRGEVAELLEVSRSSVNRYLRARRCPDCGGPAIESDVGLCAHCARRRPRTRFTREGFVDALRAWVAETGRQPTCQQWSAAYTGEADKWRSEWPRWPAAGVGKWLFGSWAAALEAAGFTPAWTPWTSADIVAAIRSWTAEHGEPPRWTDWRHAADGRPCSDAVVHHFGSWAAALAAAGQRPRILRASRWSEPAVLEAITRFRRQHGRDPTKAELARPDERYPTPSTVRRYCGGLARALATAPWPSDRH